MSEKSAPEIRFKGYTVAWERRKFKDLSEKTFGGGTPNTLIKDYWNGEIPWIQSSDLHEHQVSKIFVKKKITQNGLKNSATKLIPKNSIAIVTRVGVGKIALITFDYATSQDFLSLSDLKINQWFGVYLLYNQLQKELQNVQGTSIKGITKNELLDKKIKIPLNSQEQIHIGKFFKQLDNTIALHQRKLDKLKQLKQGYLKQIFNQELKFFGFSDEWNKSILGDLADFKKGVGYSKADLKITGTPIILYGRLYTKYETVIYSVDTYAIKNKNSFMSKGNEVVIPSSGETAEHISRASVVAVPDIIIGGDLNIIIPHKKINPTFLALNISNGKQQKELSRYAQGKSVVHLQNSDLKKINLIYPNLKEQIKISDFFTKIEDNITLQEQKISKLKKLKKAYLQKMFI